MRTDGSALRGGGVEGVGFLGDAGGGGEGVRVVLFLGADVAHGGGGIEVAHLFHDRVSVWFWGERAHPSRTSQWKAV